MEKVKFAVKGMTCSACQAAIERAVSKLEGVTSVEVNLLLNSMQVAFDPDLVEVSDIVACVAKTGYEASPMSLDAEQAGQQSGPVEDQPRTAGGVKALLVSFGFLLILMYLSMGTMLHLPLPAHLSGPTGAASLAFSQFVVCLPVVWLQRHFFVSGFKALKNFHPNMDSLIALGSSAALLYGVFVIYQLQFALARQDLASLSHYGHQLYFESSAMILCLIALGKFLEDRAKGKTGDAISQLLALAPEEARVVRDGREVNLPVADLLVGDVISIKPGERLPVDGRLVEGYSAVDESILTGESIPLEKKVGDPVYAGTINKNGAFLFEASKLGEDSSLAQIVRLVEEASGSKAPISRLADKISGYFVPLVMAIALASFLLWLASGAAFDQALTFAISVLVISCPCALGLATPVAIMVATGQAALKGILFRSGEGLEVMGKCEVIVLDKTGTVTQGAPEVTDLLPAEDWGTQLETAFSPNRLRESQLALLDLAFQLEQGSEHPLAEAIIRAGQDLDLSSRASHNYQALPGRGLKVDLDETSYYAGNLSLLEETLQATGPISKAEIRQKTEVLAQQGKTCLHFFTEEAYLGLIAVSDPIKPGSKEAVRALQDQGKELYLLTGDHHLTAQAIADRVGIGHVVAEVLPEDKDQLVADLQAKGLRVAMVGDGINDAPALARADVGVAIGAGADVAIEAADLVLMHSDLRDLVVADKLSRQTLKNIKENLFWAFFYNCMGIPVAAGLFYNLWGWQLSPMLAAGAMSLSSLFVVTNALRLRYFTRKIDKEVSDQKVEQVKTMKKILMIEGMSCGHCQKRVEETLAKLAAVDRVSADFVTGKTVLELNEDLADDILKQTVAEIGYDVVSIENEK